MAMTVVEAEAVLLFQALSAMDDPRAKEGECADFDSLFLGQNLPLRRIKEPNHFQRAAICLSALRASYRDPSRFNQQFPGSVREGHSSSG